MNARHAAALAQKTQARETKKYVRLTLWAVIGAWVYAFIAAVQLYSSERAYIGETSSQMMLYAEGKPVQVSAIFNNVGRTPATHVIIRDGVYFAAKGASVDWSKVAPTPSWSEVHQTGLTILPGLPYHFPTANQRPVDR
jgi:hypothetical protein